ncbi:MAG: DNA repair protein RecO [Bacteroidota bacterium]
MTQKTEGIVLRTVKYQEANLITTMYTLDHGLLSFIAKGVRRTNSRKKHSYFQPMSIVDMIFWHRENRDLQKLSESKTAHLLLSAQTDPVKLSLGLAVLEIFSACVKEETPNPPLYIFLKTYILELDQQERNLIHLFIFFLLHLTAHLGFFPNDKSEESSKVSLDVRGGTVSANSSGGDDISLLMRRFLYADWESCREITFDRDQKRHLIRTLFDYYHQHVEGFKYPKTMQVFAEVFG